MAATAYKAVKTPISAKTEGEEIAKYKPNGRDTMATIAMSHRTSSIAAASPVIQTPSNVTQIGLGSGRENGFAYAKTTARKKQLSELTRS